MMMIRVLALACLGLATGAVCADEIEVGFMNGVYQDLDSDLQPIRQGGIVITNAESVVFEWLADARHEQFKAVSALLK